MQNLDRPGIVELLGRLGAEDDQAVLAAARELHRKVSEAGASWDAIIRPDSPAVDAEPADGAIEREPEPKPERRTPAGEIPAADRSEASRLIERLLARKDLSATLRAELTEMKRGAADGSLDAMDSRYVRSLAKRLGA